MVKIIRRWKSIFILVVLSILLLFEVGNLLAFSWSRWKIVSSDEIIDSAIRAAYPGIYQNANELKKSYSRFKPEIRYWGHWRSTANSWREAISDDYELIQKLMGIGVYEVLLPSSVVYVKSDGRVMGSRVAWPYCWEADQCGPFPPDNSVSSVVGVIEGVQTPVHVQAAWERDRGSFVQYGPSCFKISSNSPTKGNLQLELDGRKSQILIGFGYFQLRVDEATGSYTIRQVPEEKPEKLADCQTKLFAR